MAAYISFQPSDYFSTKLYTGDDTSPKTITGVGFQPDITISTSRNVSMAKFVWDAVRGGGADKELCTNATSQEGGEDADAYGYLSAFASDGYTVTAGSINDNFVNDSSSNYVSWNWKAGTTSGISGGTITPTAYSINTTSGIGIYQYDGNGTNGATIAHGLGAVPHMIWIKCTSTSTDWYFSHHNLNGGTTPWNYAMNLNTTSAEYADTGLYDTAPTSSLVTVGNVTNTNNSGKSYMMYVFVGKKGYSKFGGFTGNSNADGPFIYTGFRPAFFCVKRRDAANKNWAMWDDKRDPYNVATTALWADTTGTETSSNYKIDFCSNGIKIRENHGDWNTGEMVYMAFSEFPSVSSNDVAGVAR